ncbi:hypothetical protein BU17DRAFT_88854 [Hysterangium stoloniferum]|nr:hypothetical protein BU17DRAFT_88854 [Hysterangium stoloniferum]
MISARKPPSATVDPTKLGATPILKKESRSQLYSSMDLARDERITAMFKEIFGRVVGPQNRGFLESISPQSSQSLSEAEFAMYKPWINFLAKCCPNLELVNAHNTPAVDFGGKQVKPDIQIYSHNFKRSGLPDITQTKMAVEFKIAVDEGFNDSGPFERSSKTARDTLGQITLYATAHQAAQFRRHVFLVLVFPKYARFMRWDRSGVIITEKVPFSNPSYLEFFWRFNNASPATRGVDTTATEFPHNHLVAVKAERSLGIEDGDRLFQVKLDPKAHNYVFRRPTYMAVGSPLGCSTPVFPVYCVEIGKLVMLKDIWRVVSPSQSSEHMIYEQLNKRVYQDAGFINGKTRSFAIEAIEYKRDGDPSERHHYSPWDAYDKAEILHIYINSGNILLTHIGGGLLIDWDLCKSFNIYTKDKPTLKGMSTSPSFRILLGILLNFLIPTHGELPPTPDRADDLESFFYVLVCIAVRYTEHRFVKGVLTKMLHAAFDDHYLDPKGAAKGGGTKKPQVPTSDPFQVSRLFNVSLKELIKTLAKTIAVRYEEAPKATEIA